MFFFTARRTLITTIMLMTLAVNSAFAGDSDFDGVDDINDNCVDISNPNQADYDVDGMGDACDSYNDLDRDNDGYDDDYDNCIATSNFDQADSDEDGFGDACDFSDDNDTGTDTDDDSVLDQDDNCPEDYNMHQVDSDHDGVGNECDSTPYRLKKLTFRSLGKYDGWVLESAEKSKQGGKIDVASSTLILGDSAKNQEYRSIVHFNTASLPDDAIVSKAIMTLKKSTIKGDVKSLGNLNVDMRQKFFGSNAGLAAADFQAKSVEEETSVGKFKVNGSAYAAALTEDGRICINKTGATQFKIHFSKDDNNDKGDDYLKFYSGNAALESTRPTLVIDYFIPDYDPDSYLEEEYADDYDDCERDWARD
jgi:hypothetical protein